jgi:hypothetical protein
MTKQCVWILHTFDPQDQDYVVVLSENLRIPTTVLNL